MAENWSSYTEGPNLGMLFYRRIYRQQPVLDKLGYNSENKSLEFNVPASDKTTPFDEFYKGLFSYSAKNFTQLNRIAGAQLFSLFTIYPGLLVGSGYTHDTNSRGDSKLGFFFDHSTGQPVIPGSSVKGVLRNIFEMDNDKNEHKYTGEKSLEFIQFILSEINVSGEGLTVENLKELKEEIFGSHDSGAGTDVFFDAAINIEKTGDAPILGNDFLTPHINHDNPELSPFTNPNPIQFIKVLPGVAFDFSFRITDSKCEPIWTAAVKLDIFKKILLTLGIGAKTNVGYGQFTATKPAPSPSSSAKRESKSDESADDEFKEKIPSDFSFMVKGKVLEGEVIGMNEKYYFIQYALSSSKTNFGIMKKSKESFAKKDVILVVGNKLQITLGADFLGGSKETINCKIVLKS